MVLRRIALSLLLSTAACAAQLATLPPSDSYTIVEGPPPQLTEDEQRLLDDVNKQFVKFGLPPATVGSYEQNAAAIMANAALAKIWHGSGRAIADENQEVIAPPVSGQEQAAAKHEVAGGRLSSLTDEQSDALIKHLHTSQHLTAHGIPPIRVAIFQTTYAAKSLQGEDLDNLVNSLRPDAVAGDLKIGVAILPAGDADARIFAVAIRDRVLDLTKGPPRYGPPGATFEFAGKSFTRDAHEIKIGLLAPDGKVQFGKALVDEQGNFATSMTIPNTPGLYEFAARNGVGYDNLIDVPIFAGISPTPWPVSADPNATPIDGTRSLSQRVAKAVAEWRHAHGAPAIPIDANLSAFAKSEALTLAKAIDASSGEGAGTPLLETEMKTGDRVRAAGFDPATVHWYVRYASDDYVNDLLARFPGGPFEAAMIGSPTAEKIGIGVLLIPNNVTKDKSLVRYLWEVLIQDPTPPGSEPTKTAEVSTAHPLTVAIRADGTMSVDGAQVDEAQLKLRCDQAKAVNADVTVVLQVELGAKPDFVQHVTDLIKGEGIVSIVSHPPEAPAPVPAAPPSTSPSPR